METRKRLQEKTISKKGESMVNKTKAESGITLIALVITMVLHYYYCIKYSNSNGFLKAIV